MRRTKTVVIEREGRDQGGVFELEELPAFQAEAWFLRAMQLLARSGANVPPDILNRGVMGFLTLGVGTILTGIGNTPWSEVEPLMAELLTCVKTYQPPGGQVALRGWGTFQQQIQEVATLLQLREEALSLHTNFSLAGRISTFRAFAMNQLATVGETMQTTDQPLEPSSLPDSPA